MSAARISLFAASSTMVLATLGGCDHDAVVLEARPRSEASLTAEADGVAASTSTIEFDREFSPPVATPGLVPGASVGIEYDVDRFFDVYDGAESLGWFASQFHCYGYGCCEVTFPAVDAHYRFDGGEPSTSPLVDGQTSIDVPQDASSLEMWFSAPGFEIRTWYCGCDRACADQNYRASQPRYYAREAWDSAFGQNYGFPIGSEGFEIVHGRDVGLISAETANAGCSSCGVFRGQIEVRNIAYAKEVDVFYTVIDAQSSDDGPWLALPAQYAGPSVGGGFERWAFEASGASFLFGETRFAIRYRVNGQTWWDNNCGQDYRLAGAGATTAGGCG